MNCTIKPTIFLYHPAWWNSDNPKVPLWAKAEIERVPTGRDLLVPTVRCDSRPMGPYKGTNPVVYHGACIFMGANRVYTMYRSDQYRGEVAQHIWDAFHDNKDTRPPKYDDFGVQVKKEVPGNYDAPLRLADGKPNPASRPLTRITDDDVAADGFKRRGKNKYWTEMGCKIWFPGWVDQGKQCDEFPFRSTREGPGDGEYVNLKWILYNNASVRPVTTSHNSMAGRDLWLFYARYRVNRTSKFWVSVKDQPPR
ncbi:hypothetical protein [Nonomuraea sp. NPDC049607]|uniref:NucA/NucB deoxyribonuclease domain-containing protein n=1 Tax=Nonomuraea sp. NPDC049607 TaxID=3154732 RepID=UPI003434199C